MNEKYTFDELDQIALLQRKFQNWCMEQGCHVVVSKEGAVCLVVRSDFDEDAILFADISSTNAENLE